MTPDDRLGELTPLSCHRCGSTDLTLDEVCHEHGQFSSLAITESGRIVSLADGVFGAGDTQPQLTRIICHACGHDWHPRRSFEGVRQ